MRRAAEVFAVVALVGLLLTRAHGTGAHVVGAVLLVVGAVGEAALSVAIGVRWVATRSRSSSR